MTTLTKSKLKDYVSLLNEATNGYAFRLGKQSIAKSILFDRIKEDLVGPTLRKRAAFKGDIKNIPSGRISTRCTVDTIYPAKRIKIKQSSIFTFWAYNKEEEVLKLGFKSGSVIMYYHVKPNEVEKFSITTSKGAYYNKYIKGVKKCKGLV